VLNRGQSLGTYPKSEIHKDDLLDMMAGGVEMQKLISELEGVRI
jgi:simple sugar transport system ATP-binding protein